MDTQWFLTRNGETIAQYSTNEFKRAVSRRLLRPTDYVRRSDSSTMISAAEFLPAGYQPRSGVPRVLGSIVAVIAVLAGLGYAAAAVAPALLRPALEVLAKLPAPGAPQTPDRDAALREALLQDESRDNVFFVLAQKDPTTFEQLMTYLIETDTGDDAERVTAGRAYIIKNVIEPKSRDLDDAGKLQLLTLNRDMSLHLATSNPKMCIAHALARPLDDTQQYLTPELKTRQSDMYMAMLDARPQTYDLLPAKDLQALNTKIGTALYETHGDEINLLDLETVPEGKEEAACRIFVAYLDGVLGLPEPERIALIRAMMLEPARLSEQPAAEAAPAETPAAGVASTTEEPATAAAPPADTASEAAPKSSTGTPADADTAGDAQAQ